MYSPPFDDGPQDNAEQDVVFNNYGYVGNYWEFVGNIGLEETYLEKYLIDAGKTKKETKEIAKDVDNKILDIIPEPIS